MNEIFNKILVGLGLKSKTNLELEEDDLLPLEDKMDDCEDKCVDVNVLSYEYEFEAEDVDIASGGDILVEAILGGNTRKRFLIMECGDSVYDLDDKKHYEDYNVIDSILCHIEKKDDEKYTELVLSKEKIKIERALKIFSDRDEKNLKSMKKTIKIKKDSDTKPMLKFKSNSNITGDSVGEYVAGDLPDPMNAKWVETAPHDPMAGVSTGTIIINLSPEESIVEKVERLNNFDSVIQESTVKSLENANVILGPDVDSSSTESVKSKKKPKKEKLLK